MALVTFFILAYMFYFIPEFKNRNSTQRFWFRLLVHPVIVVTGEVTLRHVASQPSDTPLLIKCMNMINFDQVSVLVYLPPPSHRRD